MSGGAFKYFAIFGAMRTGSNLLERNLNQYEHILCHGELFNPSFIGKEGQLEYLGITLASREDDPGKMIKKIVNKSGESIPGFRIFQGHDPRVFRQALTDSNCGKIVLRRRPIDSFISLKIAQATDQWILGNAPKRRTAQVNFDLHEYRDYLDRLSQYDQALRSGLQEAGQAAFELRYEDLKSVPVMNGLATYLGVEERRNSFEEEIKRQNPEPLSQKVSNYAQMMDELAQIGSERTESEHFPETGRGLGVRDMIVCNNVSVLLAPLPGVNVDKALFMMGQLDGAEPGTLTTGLKQKELNNWLEDARKLSSFAVVQHPLERAYQAFQKHIFPPTGATYPKIRRRLKAHFDVPLPDDLEDWSVEKHANCFEAFLVFLKSNVSGQTSIRIDGQWEMQHKLLSSISNVLPIANIVREDEIETYSAELSARHGKAVTTMPTSPSGEIRLVEIYSRRLENLARAAYAKDYRLLGFGDWAN